MPTTISNTREMLIDVARQLFARVGMENTTMNDIAQASGKGRRTLYTYFKSKQEVFLAVVDSEMERLQKMLLEVSNMKLPADEKLITFIYTRLDCLKAVVLRNGTLKAAFFRDIWSVEKARRTFDQKEIEIIESILIEGIESKIFQMPDIKITALVLHHAIRGLEVPYIKGMLGDSMAQITKRKESVMNIIFNGIRIK